MAAIVHVVSSDKEITAQIVMQYGAVQLGQSIFPQQWTQSTPTTLTLVMCE